MELCKEYKQMNCNEQGERICESFDVDFQLNLPQYLDDIEKLIKCCVKKCCVRLENYRHADKNIRQEYNVRFVS